MKSLRITYSALFVLFVAWSAVTLSQQPKRQWNIGLQQRTTLKSGGEYRSDNAVMVLESFTALCMEPSASATFEVAGPETRSISKNTGKNHMIFHDEKPGLKANANKEPFFLRAEGSITALSWID